MTEGDHPKDEQDDAEHAEKVGLPSINKPPMAIRAPMADSLPANSARSRLVIAYLTSTNVACVLVEAISGSGRSLERASSLARQYLRP